MMYVLHNIRMFTLRLYVAFLKMYIKLILENTNHVLKKCLQTILISLSQKSITNGNRRDR